MSQYTILSDYEKQKKLKEIETECARLNKSKYWILKQLGIPKSTYYDWLKVGGVSKSKAPKTIWNKTLEEIEKIILEIRNDTMLYKSERTPVGIADKLEEYGIFMTSVGVWKVLKRHGENRKFVEHKKLFIIFPRADKFMEVVCIDDIMLTNHFPREVAVFNAVDESSQTSVAISFVPHRVNRYDVISIIEQIKTNYGRFPKIIRLDNAKAHASIAVEQFCEKNNIKLQFIDAGIPQQNWPVESFNKVVKRDLIQTKLWNWNTYTDKQLLLSNYREYYNNCKPLNSDPLKRTPNEIASAISSKKTQKRLKFKLLRKHYGQVIAHRAIFNNPSIFLLPGFVRNVR